MENIEKVSVETKQAWIDNWRGIEISRILEIFDYPRVKIFFSIIETYLPKTGPILEAGCGLGPWVIKLGMLGYDITGVDYQEECIAKIKEYDPKQKVYTADIRDMPFRDNTFSAYLSWGVIEHFAQGPGEALEEAYRVLAPGGRLILTVPYKDILRRAKEPLNKVKRNSFIRSVFRKPQKAYYYQQYFGTRELRNVISENGFTIDKIMPVDHIFTLVEFSGIFRKKNTLDGENNLAVYLGGLLEKILPWPAASSILVVAHKGQDERK